MAKDDEDFKPAPVAHTIGEDLARLSVEELEHRISALKTEINPRKIQSHYKWADSGFRENFDRTCKFSV